MRNKMIVGMLGIAMIFSIQGCGQEEKKEEVKNNTEITEVVKETEDKKEEEVKTEDLNIEVGNKDNLASEKPKEDKKPALQDEVTRVKALIEKELGSKDVVYEHFNEVNTIVDKYKNDYTFFYEYGVENGEIMGTSDRLVGAKKGGNDIYYLLPELGLLTEGEMEELVGDSAHIPTQNEIDEARKILEAKFGIQEQFYEYMGEKNELVDKYRKDYIFFYENLNHEGKFVATSDCLVGIKRGTSEIYYLYPDDTIMAEEERNKKPATQSEVDAAKK